MKNNEAGEITFGYIVVSFVYHFFVDIIFGFLKLRLSDFKEFEIKERKELSKSQKRKNLKDKWKSKLEGLIDVEAMYYFLDTFDIDVVWTPIGIVEEKPYEHVDNSTKGFWLIQDDFMDKNPFTSTTCFYRLLKADEFRKEGFNNEIYIWKRFNTLYESHNGNYGYLLFKLDNGDFFRVLIEG